MALPLEAWSQPSACAGWQVADVVAHLSTMGHGFAERLARGLQGDCAAPPGLPPVSAHDEDRFAELIAQRAMAERKRLGAQLLPTFIAGNEALHQQLGTVGSGQWETLCYHPPGPITVHEMVRIRLTELTMHGWDIRAPFDPDFHLAPDNMPVLLETVARAVRRAFRPDARRTTPLRYRFCLTAPLATTQDIVLRSDGGEVDTAGTAEADLVVQGDAESYVLVLFGRWTLEQALRGGHLVVHGAPKLVSTFQQAVQGG
jgi:uncharacterized protein (TIGR03083 family)